MKGVRRDSGVHVRAEASGIVSLAGVQLLVETARATGLDGALSGGLGRWRKPGARHDPGRVVAHLAMALAAGGDCPADVAVLRAQEGLLGPVASDATVSRLVDTLAGDPAALDALRAARARAHARVVELVGPGAAAPDTGSPDTRCADGLHQRWPWARTILAAIRQLQAIPAPG